MTSHTPRLRRKRSGFTLIEVSLAVLVLGLGLMAAFGLFPAGVRQNEESIADTRAALFADYVLNGMQANAATITDWSQWRDDGYSRILGNSGSPACPNDTSLPNVVANVASSIVPITWPSTSTQKLR